MGVDPLFTPISVLLSKIGFMRWLTADDISETFSKLRQRGWGFIASKFSWHARSRTRSAFDDPGFKAANWWLIPAVKQRWNLKITGDANRSYEPYFVEKHLSGKHNLRLLSLGSGVCSHERILAHSGHFEVVHCVDIAGKLLEKARLQAEAEGLKCMSFEVGDIYQLQYEPQAWDVILFNSSLHHFRDIDTLLSQKINPWLKPDGLLLINEYVGARRLQLPGYQVAAINKVLMLLPAEKRRRYMSSRIKSRVTGPGWLRMVLADPSECVESDQILPALHRHFETLEEKPFGGNLLMLALKDIAHHFTGENGLQDLKPLFDLEDEYLQSHTSNFIYGVYRPKS